MKLIIALLMTLPFQSCISQKTEKSIDSSFSIPQITVPKATRRQSNFGMISAAHPLAIKAGEDILKEGGNAIDAAVAASFVVSVVKPQSTGIGGGGFLLYYEKNKPDVAVFDFRERAPLQATRQMYLDAEGKAKSFTFEGKTIPNASLNGHLSVGVPGLVAGLIEAHAQHGSLPLSRLMQAAIEFAQDGFVVDDELAQAIQERAEVLKHFSDSQKIFFRSGKPLATGDLLIQGDLAWSLKLIAQKGRDGFYKGDIAQKIIAEMKKGSGIITQEDLDSYSVKKRKPLIGTYRGQKIVSMPPPSSGGTHIIEILNILEGDDLKSLGHNSAPYVHILSEAMKRAYADRANYLGDPDFIDIPVQGLTAKEYAKTLRNSISIDKATPASHLTHGKPELYESPSTTHISVVDSFGNAVSSTQTINYTFGSGVVAQGTGIILNDEMDDFAIAPNSPNVFGLLGGEANSIAARKTMLSSMSPSFVFAPQGDLKMVVGSPGGSLIITATLQTILNVLDFNMSLEDAVNSPRIHHQWYPDKIRVESSALTTEVREQLETMGHAVELKPDFMGNVQAILRENNSWVGVSDGR